MKTIDTRERTARHSDDARLRACGFTILARPQNGEPWWVRKGIAFRQSDAMRRIVPAEKIPHPQEIGGEG